MNGKVYSSFKEIDKDLKILKLQREIDKEQLTHDVRSIKSSLHPSNLWGGWGAIAQKVILSLLAGKIMDRFR